MSFFPSLRSLNHEGKPFPKLLTTVPIWSSSRAECSPEKASSGREIM